MSRRKILQEIGSRLQNLRELLNFSREEMAAQCGVTMSGYGKNERGDTFPGIETLRRLSNNLDISMDWLIFNKGPMYYKKKHQEMEKPLDVEKEPEEKKQPEKKTTGLDEVMTDVRELLEYMAQDPLLRYEVLVYFYKYKKENKE